MPPTLARWIQISHPRLYAYLNGKVSIQVCPYIFVFFPLIPILGHIQGIQKVLRAHPRHCSSWEEHPLKLILRRITMSVCPYPHQTVLNICSMRSGQGVCTCNDAEDQDLLRSMDADK
jgi:hypothetical protein